MPVAFLHSSSTRSGEPGLLRLPVPAADRLICRPARNDERGILLHFRIDGSAKVIPSHRKNVERLNLRLAQYLNLRLILPLRKILCRHRRLTIVSVQAIAARFW